MTKPMEEPGEHCRLFINCSEPASAPPPPPPQKKAGSLTISAKTTVHCSPDSSMTKRNRNSHRIQMF